MILNIGSFLLRENDNERLKEDGHEMVKTNFRRLSNYLSKKSTKNREFNLGLRLWWGSTSEGQHDRRRALHGAGTLELLQQT